MIPSVHRPPTSLLVNSFMNPFSVRCKEVHHDSLNSFLLPTSMTVHPRLFLSRSMSSRSHSVDTKFLPSEDTVVLTTHATHVLRSLYPIFLVLPTCFSSGSLEGGFENLASLTLYELQSPRVFFKVLLTRISLQYAGPYLRSNVRFNAPRGYYSALERLLVSSVPYDLFVGIFFEWAYLLID